VVCLNGVGIFLGYNDPSVERLANHVEYVLDRVGPAHVGLGLDCMFDHGELAALVKSLPSTWPAGWGYDEEVRVLNPALLPELTETLLRRGRSETDVIGLLGGNLLRVAREVWR
jgi:membrane dipeptidase